MRPGCGDISMTRSPRHTASRTLWVTNTIVLRRVRPDVLDVAVKLLARQRVERRERLVHQQHARIGRERARQRDALLHAARQLVDIARA